MNYQDGFEFEHRCAAFLKAKGYRKVSVTPPSGDQGIDVIAYKSGVKYGIQCKYYSAPVGNKAVQEAYSGARFYDCDRAVVMTNHTFTKAARELADKLEVELWEHCSPGRETGKFRKLIHAFLFLFLLAGIAFAVVGAGLLFFSAKSMLAEDKLKKAKAAKEAGMRAAVGGELGETSQGKSAPSGEKKSMSIAERANLTKRLEEEEAETETDSEQNPESDTEK